MIRTRFLVAVVLALAFGYWHVNRRITANEAQYLAIMGTERQLLAVFIDKSLGVHAIDERVSHLEAQPSTKPCVTARCLGMYVITK